MTLIMVLTLIVIIAGNQWYKLKVLRVNAIEGRYCLIKG